MNLYLDTNVFLDAILLRKLSAAPLGIIDACKAGSLTGFTSSIRIANLTYILREHDKRFTKMIVQDLLSFIKISDLSAQDMSGAFELPFADREDAFQYVAAMNVPQLSAIITRNVKDFKSSTVRVMKPEDWLAQ